MSDDRSFHGRVKAGHKENAVEVPDGIVDPWRGTAVVIATGRRGIPVSCRVGDRVFASHVVKRSGRHWLLLPDLVESGSSFAVGDEVLVTIGAR